jgi:hypothetical protein
MVAILSDAAQGYLNDDINGFDGGYFQNVIYPYMNGCIENNSEAVVVAAIDKLISTIFRIWFF